MGEEPSDMYKGAVPLDAAVNHLARNAGCFGLGDIVQAYVVSWNIGGRTQEVRKDTQDYRVEEGLVLKQATSPNKGYLYELLPFLLQDRHTPYRGAVDIQLGLRKKGSYQPDETAPQPDSQGIVVESEEVWTSDGKGNVRVKQSKPRQALPKGRGRLPRRR